MLTVQGMLPAVPVGILGELVSFQWEMALVRLSLKGIGAWELGCCSTASMVLHSIPSIGAEMTTGRFLLLEEQNLCRLRAFLQALSLLHCRGWGHHCAGQCCQAARAVLAHHQPDGISTPNKLI